MKKISKFFSKLVGSVIQAAPAGTVAGAIIFYAVAVVYSIVHGNRTVLFAALGFAVLNAAGIAGALILKLPENFHKYDQDIIGRNCSAARYDSMKSFDKTAEMPFEASPPSISSTILHSASTVRRNPICLPSSSIYPSIDSPARL